MAVAVRAFRLTEAFKRDMRRAEAPIQEAARSALKKLKLNAEASSLRLHALSGYCKPTIYKIDVLPNRSWQITFELDGEEAVLLRLGTHRLIDRAPR